ncbi:MAG: geranylgeranylglyceryl/heptaprenylglyceryl phosphate synthase [Paludibacteraceae bacterium]|nr:geranylgeranylglyceryl/heptaprenylglyceryl phosphate synthase [Paludibacteraceae bacterium]MBP9648594.1 geranylgeranylglyceryl/heptaprenylglyceryl phosphate synthase [Paludibacteraceae bacterium]
MFYQNSIHKKSVNQKQLALLVDPDKYSQESLALFVELAKETLPDCIMVGGSLVAGSVEQVVQYIKSHTNIPVVLFPGNSHQLCNEADALLLLLLLSGRNADFLIGQHVVAAKAIRDSGIESISTGYILIDGGCSTSVEYMSNTKPIPRDKVEIIVATAIAGELIGNRMVYLEAGSGAINPVSKEAIQAVRQAISLPIIVGGGIRTVEQAKDAYLAGADMIVVGNALEKDRFFMRDLAQIRG